MAERARLDTWMVDHGVAESREKAQALIMAGEVTVDGRKAIKAGQAVAAGARVELLGKLRYVSRGGLKLEGALAHFGIDVTGLRCADFGSSTGGFTDCLLQAGAAHVVAIDVGTGQLDWKLRNDARVRVREGVNARYLEPADVGEPVDLAVCDVSFISATLIVPAMLRVLKPEGRIVVLVKPQFEVGRGQVGRGGIVRDPELHEESCAKIRGFVEEAGFKTDIMESPITGAEGNREFLLYGFH
jgi:23S rRNA (cytidine1920-2'-O)/16S rRNA (cytidine1409-2'-O)-methyltransferase